MTTASSMRRSPSAWPAESPRPGVHCAIGAKFPETLQFLGKDRCGPAERGDGLGAGQEAARQQRLQQRARDDFALGIERADDRRGLIALLSRRRPAVGRRRPGIERSA